MKIAGKRLFDYKKSQTLYHYGRNYCFHEHFYLFNYESEIREKIIQYKFQDKPYLYKTFSNLFISDTNFINFIKKYDLITCVPLHRKRYKSRGYNQSELIAKEIAKHFNITFCNNILIKQNNIVAQSTLNKEQRKSNISNAFTLNPNIDIKKQHTLKNKNIAIFDDIFTTGSTANECAKTLHPLNFQSIGIFTICKD